MIFMGFASNLSPNRNWNLAYSFFGNFRDTFL
jgi:hypothetical protein